MPFDLFGSIRQMLKRNKQQYLSPLAVPPSWVTRQKGILTPLAEPEAVKTGVAETPQEWGFSKIKEMSRRTEKEHPSLLKKFLGLDTTQQEMQAAPVPRPAPSPLEDKGEYTNLIKGYFPKGVAEEAIRISTDESGINPGAISPPNVDGSRDWGLFQINGIHENRIRKMFNVPDESSHEQVMRLMLDPIKNIQTAFVIWKEQGWDPWVTAERLGLTDKQKGLTR